MSVSFQLDHLVIAVTDLQHAIADYKAFGFNVIPGGRHQHAPTQNALVYFADGTYLELIEWTAPAPAEKWYEQLSRHGDGLVDFAFVPSRMGDAIIQAEEGGAHYRGPIDGSRIKPSGEQVRWQLGWPITYALPFLCGDITPRSLRVPEGDVRKHPNLACGISSIAIAVDDLRVAEEAYRALLGSDSEAVFGTPTLLEKTGIEVLTIRLGAADIHLVTDDGTDSTGFRQVLDNKGQGVYRVCVKGADHSPSQARVPISKHGIELTHKTLSLIEQTRWQ